MRYCRPRVLENLPPAQAMQKTLVGHALCACNLSVNNAARAYKQRVAKHLAWTR